MRKSKTVLSERERFIQKRQKNKRFIALCRIMLLVIFIGVWEGAARIGLIDDFIFSSPTRSLSAMARMLADGSLWRHMGVTLAETMIGFISGTLAGFLLAIPLYENETARRIFDPYLVVLNSLPKIALGPVIIVWVGAGMGAIITVTLLVSVVVTVIGVLNGFSEVDEEKILLLRTLGATRRQIFTKVVFPASLATTVSVLKINVGMSWVGVIVGEFLVSRAGLGYLIVYGGQVFRMDLVMGSIIILCVFAALMYYGVYLLEKYTVKRITAPRL